MAAQLPDCIIVNGEFRDLYSNPLEQYWTLSGKKRPAFIPSHECIRGYVAIWHLKDNQLFLLDVDGTCERKFSLFGNKSTRFTLKTLLSGARQPVKASWFSGKLRVPEGKMTAYEHNDYDSRFEKEVIITIEKGDLVKMVTLDYKQKVLMLNSEVLMRSRQESRMGNS